MPVAIDFDGVICDSQDECLVVAVNAYDEFRTGESSDLGLANIEADFLRRFRRQRHFVRPAGEYWLLVHWLSQREDDLDRDTFLRWKNQHRAEVVDFEPLFFSVRNRMRSRNEPGWRALHRPFSQCLEAWADLGRLASIHIVTTKDDESVRILGDGWGLDVPPSCRWARERNLSKAEAIRRLAAIEGCALSDVHFIDDSPEHLRDVAVTGARCHWASWGYTPAAEATEFPSLKRLADLVPLLATETA